MPAASCLTRKESLLAKVVPFEATHYNTARFGKDVARLVAPPYDVIDPVLERKLKDDRLNVTHIILGDESDGYCVASRRLRTWLDDQVLVKDQGKGFYIYEQKFSTPDGSTRIRSGIVGLVKLEEFSKGVVMPHEKTIPKHKEDRMQLIRAVSGDTEQILLLYDDPSGEIESILLKSRGLEEEQRFVDNDGVHHRIIRLSDPKLVERITELFEPVKLLIADGHHRYETSLEYRDMMRAREAGDEERPYDFIIATMVSSRNPGLIVYPTHRLVNNVGPELIAKLPKALEKEFRLHEFPGTEELATSVDSSSESAFGVWIPSSKTCLLATKRKAGPSENPMEDLPVWIVQERVLKNLLNYTSDMLDKKVNIDYVKGTGPAKLAMASGEYQACFFVRPPTVQQVMAIAKTGQKMPHKSTYFFPKIWSGTLLHLF